MASETVLGLGALAVIGLGAGVLLTNALDDDGASDRENQVSDLAQTRFSTHDKPAAIEDAVASPRSISEIGTIFDAVERTVADRDKLDVLHDALYSHWSAGSISNYLRNELQYYNDAAKAGAADAALHGPNPGY